MNLVKEGEGRGRGRGLRESFSSTITLIPYVACNASETKAIAMNFYQSNIVL
jgi:hypothetical protein